MPAPLVAFLLLIHCVAAITQAQAEVVTSDDELESAVRQAQAFSGLSPLL